MRSEFIMLQIADVLPSKSTPRSMVVPQVGHAAALFDKDVVTFDCYGTLIDWESGILGALGPMLAARGIAVEADALLMLYAELEVEEERGAYKPYRDVLAGAVDGIGRKHGFTPTVPERRVLADSVPNWLPF